MMTNKKTTAILQILFFTAMITVNALANILPINGYNTGEVSNMYPNLFVPAPFTFSIWGIIYLLLLCWVVYSSRLLWRNNEALAANQLVVNIAPLFIMSCLLNASWILVWHFLYPLLSLGVIICFFSVLLVIYLRLQQWRHSLSVLQRWMLYIPFVLYLAWLCVATIANTTAVLVYYQWSALGIEAWIWSCIMIAVAGLLSAWFGFARKEFAFSLVVAWALFGIYSSQHTTNESIGIAALVGCGISLLAVVWGMLKNGGGGAVKYWVANPIK